MSQAARGSCSKRRVELAPVKPVTGTWMTPVQRDPLEVPIEEKIALLLAANEAALEGADASGSSTRGWRCFAKSKTLVTTEGTNVTQTMIRVGPAFSATAIGDNGDFQVYEHEIAPRGQGWEYIESLDMPGNAGALGVARGRESIRPGASSPASTI